MLEGKAALVTGGSRGIGRAIVERLARDGADVVFTYRDNHDAAQEVVAAVTAADGSAVPVRADQGDAASTDLMFDAVERKCGRLDILVNSAAINSQMPIAELGGDDFDRVMAVNVKGPLLAMRRAGEVLSDNGRIINISTLNTVVPAPGRALYIASKGALEQVTAVAAREFGARGITVNAVSPGATDTDLLRESNPSGAPEAVVGFTALRRLGEPADVADVVAFLAGPDSRWITGQNLRASGGLFV